MFVFIFVGIALFGMAANTLADDNRPHWSAEVKFGQFRPDLDEWDTFYNKDYMWQYGAALAYKVIRQLDIGLEASYMSQSGKGILPLNNQVGGDVDYTLIPVSAFVTLRAVFSESQIIVPYVGGGVTRMYYEQDVDGGKTSKGNTDGSYYKAGVQFLLDRVDTTGASILKRDFGIYNTYLFFEFANTTAEIDDVNGDEVDLGGKSYFLGLLFEL